MKNPWIKCISVLLCISLISGVLLTVLYYLLAVSAEERTMRAIKKIYGEEKTYSVILDIDGSDPETNTAIAYGDFGTINKIFLIGDKTADTYDLLFNATGEHGYKNGTITLWVQVNVSESGKKIEKVILESFTKQTLMSKLGSDFYDGFIGDVDGESRYTPVSGATYSSNAAANAINCVVQYLRENAQ